MKTLSFMVGDGAVLVCAAGDTKVDNPKFKAEFHTKAKMVPGDRVEELVGHAPGGVCPFSVPGGVSVYLDESIRRFEYVYPACGSSNSAVRLTPRELEGGDLLREVGRRVQARGLRRLLLARLVAPGSAAPQFGACPFSEAIAGTWLPIGDVVDL